MGTIVSATSCITCRLLDECSVNMDMGMVQLVRVTAVVGHCWIRMVMLMMMWRMISLLLPCGFNLVAHARTEASFALRARR
jgi:hypothetical protein